MKFRYLVVLVPALAALSAISLRAQDGTSLFRKALSMYGSGMYQEAETLFRTFAAQTGDPLAEGYAVLSAVRQSSDGCPDMVADFSEAQPSSVLLPEIIFAEAEILFDKGEYSRAETIMRGVEPSDLPASERDRFLFKRAYSSYAAGHYDEARDLLAEVADGGSEYNHAAEYALAYIYYDKSRFGEAFKYFSRAAEGAEFYSPSLYYMTECRFMQKDYNYVVSDGVAAFDKVPQEKRAQMGRLISESYLILGDAASAVKYYEENVTTSSNPRDADWFYAGSVQYAVGNWSKAIDSYSKMVHRRDSLWQIASYHIGYSNIQIRNKVEALEAFKSAASLSFDPALQEDAFYNWAKLAFDINNDPAPFTSYMQKYPAKEKSEKIYSYIALAALLNHDYAAAIEAYDNIDELDDKDRRNYVKANYLRAEQLIGALSWRGAVPCLRAASYYAGEDEPVRPLTNYWLGQSYFMDDKFEDAVTVFTDLYNTSSLQDRSEASRVPYDLAYCYFKQKDWAGAARWFDRYIASGDTDVLKDARVRRADCDFYRKDYKSASSLYEAVYTDYPDPDDVYVYYQDAMASGLLGNKARKIARLETVLKASRTAPLYSEAMYELGSAYAEKGVSDEAVRVFRTLRSTTTSTDFAAKSLLRLGMISAEKRNYNKALEYYKDVVKEYSGTEYADMALGSIESVYTEMGQKDKYLDYASSLGALEEKTEAETEQMYFESAEQVYLSANYSQAVSALENFKVRYPSSAFCPKADYYIAESYRNLGRKDLALDYYSEAIENGAGDYVDSAMKRYAALAYEVERYGDAFGAYSAIREAASDRTAMLESATGMVRSAFKSRNFADAVTSADDILDMGVSGDLEREVLYIKAKSLLSLSQRDEALEIMRTLAKAPLTAEGAEARYILIQDSYDRGNFKALGSAVTEFSSTGTPHVYWLARALIVLGDSYAAEGNNTQARYVYEGVARNYEGDDDVTELVSLRLRKLESGK